MVIIDKELLAEFRARNCEWCGARNRGNVHPHHVFGRGMGGGQRLDVRVNLVALCAQCHTHAHAGRISRAELIAVVCLREKILPAKVEDTIYRLRREGKGGPCNDADGDGAGGQRGRDDRLPGLRQGLDGGAGDAPGPDPLPGD